MGLLCGVVASQRQLPSAPEDAAAVVSRERAMEGLKAKRKSCGVWMRITTFDLLKSCKPAEA